MSTQLPSILSVADKARGGARDPYRLSESTLNLFNACERKFQLIRMLNTGSSEYTSSPATVRGNALGAGVQMYLLTGDMDRALAAAWLAYWPDLENRPELSCARTLNNLRAAQAQLDAIRERYEVAVFDGKPAIELSFRLDTHTRWYDVGYIDVVMWDKKLKMFVVFELKTTGYNMLDLRPLYKNSSQALGYSIVLDKIAGSEQNRFGVVYLVIRDKRSDPVPDVYLFEFPKTLTDRLRWFVTLGLDIERLERLSALGIFPMRGNSCVRFNRPCQFFGSCHMTSWDDDPRTVPPDTIEYQFRYNLQELIDSHLARVGREEQVVEEVRNAIDLDAQLSDPDDLVETLL